MRAALLLIGVILLAGGIWVTIGDANYKQTDTLVQLGPAKLEATHDKAVPQWLGIAGIVAGVALAIGGFVKR